MKKLTAIILTGALMLTATFAQNARKPLVVYFAYSENMGNTSGMALDAVSSASLNAKTKNTDGNLQVMAKEIVRQTGADVHQILVSDPYNPDYRTMLNRAVDESRNKKKPALKSRLNNLSDYDVVYLGIPVWNNELPLAVVNFLEQYDFSGKTIVPFGIHLGSRWGNMLRQIEQLEPKAKPVSGYTVNAGTANEKVRSDFAAWLEKNKAN